MIHETAPHSFDNSFRNCRAGREDSALFFFRGNIFLPEDLARGTFPRLKDYPCSLTEEVGCGCSTEYLFSMDGKPFFLLNGGKNAERTAEKLKAASGWREHPPAFFKTFEPGYLAFAGITARHISIWRENRIFCGRCGSENIPSETERAAVCPSCGLTVYPEIMPAVIVAVYDGDRLLMVRSEKASYKHFALVAGYTEIGETFEQTVRREVMEETGLRIKNIRYFGNQPWGFSNSQMVGFFAELDGSPEITLQESELTEARWFDRRDIPLPPYKTSIGNRMISLFRENAVPE